MYKNIKQRKLSGFTLIELLVVIAMIGIMTSVMVVSMQEGRNQRAVDVAARQVAATVRMAQSYAVAGRYESNGRIPCAFYFFAQNATGEYGVRYTYHTRNSTTCTSTPTTIVSYTAVNGVTLSQVNNLAFTIPQGTVDQDISAVTRITLSKGTVSTDVCVDGFGRVREGC